MIAFQKMKKGGGNSQWQPIAKHKEANEQANILT